MSGKPTAPEVPGHEVLAYLGRGGMGTVWKARRDDGGLVALKLLEMRLGSDAGDGERFFRRESLACLNLDHPHLVRGREVGRTADGVPYLTLDFVEGETLWKRVRTAGPLDLATLVRIGVQLADALAYAHARKLVHGDVKPQNVMLDERGDARLLDLGLVTAPGVEAGEKVYASAAYGAPETLRDGALTPRTDLYSLGATLICALTGRAPYRGKSQREIALAVLAGPPEVPEQVDGREVDADVSRVLSRLTRADPAERYGSAEELRLELASLADGDRPLGALLADHVDAPTAHAGNRGSLVAAVGIVAVALLGVAWWAAGTDDAEPAEQPVAPAQNTAQPLPPTDPHAFEVGALIASLAESPDEFATGRAWIDRLLATDLSDELRTRVVAASSALDGRFAARAAELLAIRRTEAERLAAAGDWEGVKRVLGDWPEAFTSTDQARAARDLISELESRAAERLVTLLVEAERQAAAWSADPPVDRAAIERLLSRLEAAVAAAPPDSLPSPRVIVVSAQLYGMGARVDSAHTERAASEAWREGAREAHVGTAEQWRTWLVARRGDPALAGREVGLLLKTVMARADAVDQDLRGRIARVAGRPWAACQRGTRFGFSTASASREPTDVFARWMLDEADGGAVDEAAALGLDPAEIAAWRFAYLAEPGAADLPGGDLTTALHALGEGVPLVTPLLRATAPTWPTAVRLTLRADAAELKGLTADAQPLRSWLAAARGQRSRRSQRATTALQGAREVYLSGDLPRAWELLGRALAELPADAEVAVMRGRVLWMLSEPLRTTRVAFEALAEARRAWDLEPSLPAGPQLFAEVALYLLESERLPRATIEPVALLACEETWRQGQASGPALRMLGKHRLEEKRPRDAAPLLRRAAELLPRDGSVQLLLGKAELELRRRDAGRAALQRARELLGADFPPWAAALLQLLGEE